MTLSGAQAAQTAVADSSSDGGHSVPIPAIVGIVLSGLAIAACWIYLVRRRWRRTNDSPSVDPLTAERGSETMPWTRSMAAVAALPPVGSPPHSAASDTSLLRGWRPDIVATGADDDATSVSRTTEVRRSVIPLDVL